MASSKKQNINIFCIDDVLDFYAERDVKKIKKLEKKKSKKDKSHGLKISDKDLDKDGNLIVEIKRI